MKIEKLTEEFITTEFLETLNSLRSTYLSVEEAKKLWKEKSFPLIYIAIENDKVIGTATLIIEQKFIRKGALCAHIEDVAVHPQYRNHGIGKSLIEKLVEVAREEKCYKVVLDCASNLVSFYQKCCFKSSEVQMRLDI